jgi:hypothetical protein
LAAVANNKIKDPVYDIAAKISGEHDQAAMYDAVRATAPGVEFTRVGDEYHWLNFTALEGLKSDTTFETRDFKSQGRYIDGEGYQQGISKAGRSDLQQWVDRKAGAVKAINTEFAAKYGWDKSGDESAKGPGEKAAKVSEGHLRSSDLMGFDSGSPGDLFLQRFDLVLHFLATTNAE